MRGSYVTARWRSTNAPSAAQRAAPRRRAAARRHPLQVRARDLLPVEPELARDAEQDAAQVHGRRELAVAVRLDVLDVVAGDLGALRDLLDRDARAPRGRWRSTSPVQAAASGTATSRARRGGGRAAARRLDGAPARRRSGDAGASRLGGIGVRGGAPCGASRARSGAGSGAASGRAAAARPARGARRRRGSGARPRRRSPPRRRRPSVVAASSSSSSLVRAAARASRARG